MMSDGGARGLRLLPRTLRARLVSAAAGAILVAVALFAIAVVLVLGHELRGSLDKALRQRAQDVAQLAVSAPAVLTNPGALESPASGRQIAVEVIDAGGRILARSLTLGARLLPQDRLAQRARLRGATGFEEIAIDGRPYRLYAVPIAQAGGPAAGGAVLVASDTSDISSAIGHLGVVLTLSGAGAALLAALIAAALTARGLSPLRRLAGAAGEIERTADPSLRLPQAGAADEVGQLTGVLNRMLASLQRSRESERRFLADASHELRTPVTTLLGNVEYAVAYGADVEVLADLRHDAGRLARLVDDLLVLERAGAPAGQLEPLALDELVSRLVGAHAAFGEHAALGAHAGAGADEGARAQERPGAQIRLAEIEPVRVVADEEALGRVLENLLENAVVHGPADGEVGVTLRRVGPRALLMVRDAGPGPDPATRERLFERFWRGPDASGRPGSGLGLSIAAAIVERHGGRILVDGAAFTVELPALEPLAED
ncbi:MAG: HAMP domain-containing sensor histidine kinase [Solirubrobacteraceae bacterium]